MSDRSDRDAAGAAPQCVVVVGPSHDCCEVLKTALSRRGMTAFASTEARSVLRLIREHHPAVVVLDGETKGASDGMLQEELCSQLQREKAALVVLGRLRGQKLLPQQVLSKPYHFAPLVHTIEALAARAA